ncbi:peptidoglycan DD-metalloendopeptidase family protein [Alcaligenaceae bacterium CGII-47]|nr:peptidoglycan DD-metalloendopeptidase family protein [Alcaligenaceae bacterium CGII-47]
MTPRCLGLGLILCVVFGLAQGAPSLEARQSEAREQRSALRTQIGELQSRIEDTESSRHDASVKLRASEQAISDISRRLDELSRQRKALQTSLSELEGAIKDHSQQMRRQQDALAQQLRAQYASGLSPWTALLSGEDPQSIGRELAYLSYISRARTEALQALRVTIDKLSALQERVSAQRTELEGVQAEVLAQKKDLEIQQDKRRKVLDTIKVQLQAQRGQAQQLETREQRLGNLIDGLAVEIARAQARARAEAERRAKAEAKARAAAKAREDQEVAAARAAAAQVAAARSAEEDQMSGASPSSARVADEEPAGGFKGLKKGLPHPVAGEMLGRFGAERPDGSGLWRGIVLRAAPGAPVHAVAPGRVVYASWLSGFGNILIIDHGEKYLSVYAYNQSLLRQVGDIVARGDEVARVGATGGQVEPGLYFEIRHAGAPVNPQLWLKP